MQKFELAVGQHLVQLSLGSGLMPALWGNPNPDSDWPTSPAKKAAPDRSQGQVTF